MIIIIADSSSSLPESTRGGFSCRVYVRGLEGYPSHCVYSVFLLGKECQIQHGGLWNINITFFQDEQLFKSAMSSHSGGYCSLRSFI